MFRRLFGRSEETFTSIDSGFAFSDLGRGTCGERMTDCVVLGLKESSRYSGEYTSDSSPQPRTHRQVFASQRGMTPTDS